MIENNNRMLLSKKVFHLDSILKAIEAYQSLGRIELVDKPDQFHFQICFSDCIYSAQLTMNEFENYVIGLENTRCSK